MGLRRNGIAVWLTPCVAALAFCLDASPAPAGNLTKCDLARVAAHNTILRAYGRVVAELDTKIADAKAKNLDPTDLAYADDENATQRVNIVALRADLQAQEARDTGQTDKEIARNCDDQTQSTEEITGAAEALAKRGIASVLPKHMGFEGF